MVEAPLNKTELENKSIFLISPVRNIELEEQRAIERYITQLEAEGYQVHFPFRDTDQNDLVGLRICQDNRDAIESAAAIHIWYNPSSVGSVFDLGMAFALGKPIILANPERVIATEGKSFSNVLLALHQKYSQQS